jgi:hypothetical protein
MALSAQANSLARDLTGHYETPPTKQCSSELLNHPEAGNAYKWHCFTGNAYGYSRTLSLIQNGRKLCGVYFECGGINCNKIYSGSLAGQIKGDKVTIYYSNGHRGDTEAEQLDFRIVKDGLVEADSKHNEATLISRSSQMKFPNAKLLCNPAIPSRVMLSAQGDLMVSGILDEQQSQFANLKQRNFASAPLKKAINLSQGKSDFGWRDVRQNSNYVLRELVVTNGSRKNWIVSVEYSDACREFLGSSYHKEFRKPLPQTDEFRSGDGIEIKPGGKIQADSCFDSQWRFEKAQKMCPPYQCLEGCKC